MVNSAFGGSTVPLWNTLLGGIANYKHVKHLNIYHTNSGKSYHIGHISHSTYPSQTVEFYQDMTLSYGVNL